MKEIYILGSGGFAKEVYFLINEINHKFENPIYNFKGFISKTNEISELIIGKLKLPVIFEEHFFKMPINEVSCLAIGIGDPNILEKIYNRWIDKYDFPNLIHPNFVSHEQTIEMGSGNIITSGNIFTIDIKIGSFNIFNLNTTVGHDANIGSFNVINPGANISGGVKIGNSNLIGSNATILQYIELGNNSILGSGAVLTKNLESNVIAVGLPAKPVKYNS